METSQAIIRTVGLGEGKEGDLVLVGVLYRFGDVAFLGDLDDGGIARAGEFIPTL